VSDDVDILRDYVQVELLLRPATLLLLTDEELGKVMRPMVAKAKLLWDAESFVQ